MTPRFPFPSVIDNSLIKALRSCERKVELEYLLHYKPRTPSVHLHAGKAFAHGLEKARLAYYIDGKSPLDSVATGVSALLAEYGDFECPDDSPKSAIRMAGALEYYFSVWPFGEDKAEPLVLPSGQRMIEFSFLEPIDFLHPETGDPLLYSGRFDMGVGFAGGRYGEDDKTASSLGPTWEKQWEMETQFTGYTWGAAQGGMKLDGFLVRGVSILKTKYDHAQALTYRPQWRIDRWYDQLLKDLARLKAAWETGVFAFDEGHACNEYGGCLFRQVCQSKDPADWLKTYYTRRQWDPVARIETTLPHEE